MKFSSIFPLAIMVACAATGPSLAASVSSADRDYLTQDAQGAAYELALAKLATDKASRDDVKSYARKLVTDHETYNAALLELGKSKGLQLPTDVDASDQAKLTAMKTLSGATFDKAFIEEAMSVNNADIHDSDREKATTGDAEIKQFVTKFGDMDQEHEKIAKSLNAAK